MATPQKLNLPCLCFMPLGKYLDQSSARKNIFLRCLWTPEKREVHFARKTDLHKLEAWTLSKAELRQAWWLSTLKPCRSTNMAAQEEWCFEEEGCLQFSGRPISVTFSPTSNCFICTLEDGTIEVVDARSSLRLKHTAPAGKLRSDEACV